MASVILTGDTSGSVTLSAPTVAGSTTQTLVNVTGTLAPLVSDTAVASTSGTSIDFTSIPSWVKRITVMFNGVSTSGISVMQLQLGSGTIQTTGYLGSYTSSSSALITTGLGLTFGSGASTVSNGKAEICLLNSNTFVMTSMLGKSDAAGTMWGGSSITLSGTLDRVRITTVNGTDTFDAGSINIMYE